jgi:hypothetical protein
VPTCSTPAPDTSAIDLHSSCRIVLPAGSYLTAFSNRLTGCLNDRHISGLDDIQVRAFFHSRASVTSFHSMASSSTLA